MHPFNFVPRPPRLAPVNMTYLSQIYHILIAFSLEYVFVPLWIIQTGDTGFIPLPAASTVITGIKGFKIVFVWH